MAVEVLNVKALRVSGADPAILMEEDESMAVYPNEALDFISERLVVGNWDSRFGFGSKIRTIP